jgi:hypothetical protein
MEAAGFSRMAVTMYQAIYYCHVLRFHCMTYKVGLGLDDWIYWHLGHTTTQLQAIQHYADPRTSRVTVVHAVGFSLLTSCIPATDLSQSHCNFKSHVKCSFHFFTIIFDCNLQNSNHFSAPNSLCYIASSQTLRKTPSSVVAYSCTHVRQSIV